MDKLWPSKHKTGLPDRRQGDMRQRGNHQTTGRDSEWSHSKSDDRSLRRDTNERDVTDVVLIIQALLDSEARSVGNYQSLLWVTQAALFGAAWVLRGEPHGGGTFSTLVGLALAGITCAWFFGWPSVYHAYNVDRLRDCMVKLCDEAGSPWHRAALAAAGLKWMPVSGGARRLLGAIFGHWFENIFVSLVLAGWTAILWVIPGPTWAIWVSTGLAVGWPAFLVGFPHFMRLNRGPVSP